MRILLGIDVGRVKTGVARSIGKLTEPLVVIREKNPEQLAQIIAKICQKEKAAKVIIGLPEGRIKAYAQQIADLLTKRGIPSLLWDETLTTKDAQKYALAAGISLKKRRRLEDAFAAAVILQSYLDAHQVRDLLNL